MCRLRSQTAQGSNLGSYVIPACVALDSYLVSTLPGKRGMVM